jgi:F0F1-type ATP synthase membrane subunit b/b'
VGEDRLTEPVRAQLGRLAAQLHGLQQQLDLFLARRSEAVADQASQHVAAIVAAAEESAAEIRASAERDAAAVRERYLADVQAEVERISVEAQADAGRIRTEAHAEAARLREQAVTQATAEIEGFVARLGADLQASARAAVAGIARGTPRAAAPVNESPRTSPGEVRALAHQKQIADEVEEAVDELQAAAAALEESLRHLRATGTEEKPAS